MGKKKKGGHRAKANKAKVSSSPKSGKKPNASSAGSDLVVSLKGLPGLSNLGNTCFFNAVMQNIGQSHAFRMRMGSLVESPTFSVELQLPRPESELKVEVVGEPGELTRKLHDFLKVMQSSGGRTINPRPVFQEISQKGSRFAGYQRQDSQELLRYLLDKLRNEEVDRIKRAILNSFGVTGKATQQQLTDAQKSDIRKYGMQALMAQTFVDDVFGGMLVSTVKCVECGNCTSMKETFLDLSLPVAEDKGSGGGGGGGHQMRDRKGPGQSTSKALPKDVSQENIPISKHQRKKQQRESRRATKKCNRVTKNLQDFLSEDHSNTTSTPTSDLPNNDTLTISPERTATPTESETVDQQQPENEPLLEPNSSIDPATGEPQLIADDETSQEPQPEPVSENGDAASALGVSSYASSGPQEDKASPPSQEPTPAALPSSEQAPLIGELEGLKLEDCESNTEECDKESKVDEEKKTVGKSADSEPFTKDDVDKMSVHKSNSLLFSFEKFCAREILTGDNKFACAVCTKELAEKTAAHLEKRNGETLGGSEEKESASQRVAGEVERNETIKDGEVEEDRKEKEENEETEKNEKTEETEETEENGETEENEDEEEGSEIEELEDKSSKDEEGSSSEVKIAFCDAIKQILIETPPPVLTLHLKRFSHQGKKLKKNNRHISFPALLDLRPFCTQNCQDLCDASGRVLYSLYGVVVHSGGMQDGHYTSYTKTRPPLCTNLPASQATQEALGEAALEQMPLQEAVRETSPEGAEVVRADVEADDCSKQYNSSTGEPVTSDNPDPALPKKLPNTGDTSCKSEEDSLPACAALTTKPLTNAAEKAAELTSPEKDSLKNTGHDPQCSSKEFDFSVTAGQWYYASDTHVKVASEDEVMKSQAYLLFYERLPFRS